MAFHQAGDPDVGGEELLEHRPYVWLTIESTVSVFFAFVFGFVTAVLGRESRLHQPR